MTAAVGNPRRATRAPLAGSLAIALTRSRSRGGAARVYFDIVIGSQPAGRLVFELRADVVPRTSENFEQLCTGEAGQSDARRDLTFRGSTFHRSVPCTAPPFKGTPLGITHPTDVASIIPNFVCQGGDITAGNGVARAPGHNHPRSTLNRPISAQALAGSQFTGRRSRTRILCCATPDLASCPWRTRGPTATARRSACLRPTG